MIVKISCHINICLRKHRIFSVSFIPIGLELKEIPQNYFDDAMRMPNEKDKPLLNLQKLQSHAKHLIFQVIDNYMSSFCGWLFSS